MKFPKQDKPDRLKFSTKGKTPPVDMTTVLTSLKKLITKVVDNLSDLYIPGKTISDKDLFANAKDTL